MTTVIVDTSGILTILDESQDGHDGVRALIASNDLRLIVSPLVVAEADYMLTSRLGASAAHAFALDVVRGGYELAPWTVEDHARAIHVNQRYGLSLGLADASNIVLADNYRTETLMTNDHRHFRSARPLSSGSAFRLLPHDSLPVDVGGDA